MNCAACAQLKREWYQRLEDLGFEDAEKALGSAQANYNYPPEDAGSVFQNSRGSYYRWAREKLSSSEFKSHTDKIIWEYHSEGMSRREIAPRIGLEQSWITRKLHKIEKYLKEYTVGSMSYASA